MALKLGLICYHGNLFQQKNYCKKSETDRFQIRFSKRERERERCLPEDFHFQTNGRFCFINILIMIAIYHKSKSERYHFCEHSGVSL